MTAQPLTGSEKARDDAKLALAARYARTRNAPATTSRALGVSYQHQVDSTWCGPATLAIILGYKHWGWTGTATSQQTSAAGLLGVPHNGDGTPWIGADNVPTGGPWESSYPMEDALNYKQYQHVHGVWWQAHALPGSPSSGDISTYQHNLVYDIDRSYPFADNEYAAPGYGLQKQPSNSWIMHWFASSGYYSSGAGTYFSDPGWGGGTRSYDSTHDVVVADGGRGYVW